MNKYGLENIIIKNLWYMIAYDIVSLSDLDPGKISYENDVTGSNDLMATMLCEAYEFIQNDLDKEFTSRELLSDRPYGKIDLEKSYKTGVISRGQLYCDVNTEDNNSIYNQVIKATFKLLRNCHGVSKKLIKRIDNNIKTLSDVDDIEIYKELVDKITGVPERYAHVWTLAILIVNMWFASDEYGVHNLLELNDNKKIAKIFEHFGVNLGKSEFTGGITTKPVYLVRESINSNKISRRNKLDMMLRNDKNVAIIDFKFYDKMRVDNDSENIREVLDYATSFFEQDKHKDKYDSIKCVLLYAYRGNAKGAFRYKETKVINGKTYIIYKRAIDLSLSFEEIKEQMISIYTEALSN